MAFDPGHFTVTVEVVPPAGDDASVMISLLQDLGRLDFDGFSVATNPVAKPRMCAMAACSLIQQATKRPCILHCTTRDHNRISLQGLLWGAKAMGIDTVLCATGDFVAMKDRGSVSDVKDVDVLDLVSMACESGFQTGVVLDWRPESGGLEHEIRRLEKKADAGAAFAVTQPVYDEDTARLLHDAVQHIGIPVIMGILPLRSPRHAVFLHEKVAGIEVPESVRNRMDQAADPVYEGAVLSGQMMDTARELFAGACIMPPFDHYEILFDII
ncbi:MAG: methylenetetrahydrofolate reductase [Desulfobacteraceae bacterium]